MGDGKQEKDIDDFNMIELALDDKFAEDMNDLDAIQLIMEDEISNYEIIETENLYDEDEERIYREFVFNRGVKHHKIVIHPECFIKAASKKTPSSLIVNISNILVCWIYAKQ